MSSSIQLTALPQNINPRPQDITRGVTPSPSTTLTTVSRITNPSPRSSPTSLSLTTPTTHPYPALVLSSIGRSIKSCLGSDFTTGVIALAGLIVAATLGVLGVLWAKKQLDVAQWTFCKSYPDDAQVITSATCAKYASKGSFDELKRRILAPSQSHNDAVVSASTHGHSYDTVHTPTAKVSSSNPTAQCMLLIMCIAILEVKRQSVGWFRSEDRYIFVFGTMALMMPVLVTLMLLVQQIFSWILLLPVCLILWANTFMPLVIVWMSGRRMGMNWDHVYYALMVVNTTIVPAFVGLAVLYQQMGYWSSVMVGCALVWASYEAVSELSRAFVLLDSNRKKS